MQKFKDFTEKFSLSGGSLFTYYACFYMAISPFTCYITSYYSDIGLSASQIGLISGIGPLITIIGQMIWGRMADKAYYKNTVLMIATIGTAVVLYMFTWGKSYPFLIIMNILYSFINCSVMQISDSIALEYSTAHNLRFSTMRMGGSIGYAVCNIFIGLILVGHTDRLFMVNIVLIAVSIVSLLFVPKVRGSIDRKNKLQITALLKDKKLIILLIFNFILYLGYFFNMSFYGVMMRSYGATNLHIGIAQAICAFCEVPFLLFSQKIINKIGIKTTLILSTLTFCARWLLYGSLTNVWGLVFAASLHGTGHIVISYCTASYINKTVKQSLRASGQTLLGMVNYGFSKCIATLVGGVIVDATSLSTVYLSLACLSVLSGVFLLIFLPKIKEDI